MPNIFAGKTPMVIFLEVIIGAVTLIWCLNFFATIWVNGYDGNEINKIFMAIVGGGVFMTTLANKAVQTTSSSSSSRET